MEHWRACRQGRGVGFTIPGAEPNYAPDLALEPKHIEVRLHFEIEAERATGCVTTTVRGNRPETRSLRLDAIGFSDVDVSGEEPLSWRYDGEAIQVTWERPFARGEERKVEVRYAIQFPVTGLNFSHPDEAYPERPLLVGSDHETERARYWLPCVDYPTVRTTFDFHLTAPADLTILANGTLEDEQDNEDGTKTAHWKLDFPCPSYLCCVAAGKFSRFDDESVEGRKIAYFASEHISPKDLQRAFGRTPELMRWLVGRLQVHFPFAKYYQLALPGIGGAMENISLVAWDEIYVVDEALEPELGFRVDSINLHEMSHSYFGDAVVCRHFEHSWLKESWATYLETVWREENHGRDEAHYDLHRNAKRYSHEADKRYVRPIVTRTYNSSWDLFDAHLYPGGAWRLHMLRRFVGDKAFWAGTRDYLESYQGRLVETDDFRRKLEQHSGLNLVPFFDQWIHGKGYPKLKATFRQDAEKGRGTLVVEQTQEDEKKGVGLFRFPLVIEYDDDQGSHRIELAIEGARQTAILPTTGKCKQVRFDPDCQALFGLEFHPGDDMLKHSLRHAKDIRNRIRAAQALIKTGTRENMQSVLEACTDESFWGVRVAVAQALGRSGHAAAIEVLASLLAGEQDPRVSAALAHACGKMRDPRLRDALLAFLDREPKPAPAPLARAAALAALGAQRDERDLDRLAEATRIQGSHGQVARGAWRGLGALGSQRALDWIEPRLSYGSEPEQSRPAAVEGYGKGARRLAPEVRQRAVDRLIDLTRDRHEGTRMKAGAALAGLGEPSAIPALESLKRREAKQEAPRIERWIASLRKGKPGEEQTKLREQVEKLEQRCRKLDERIQDLEARDKK